MAAKTPIILGDLGGTHMRLACANGEALEHMKIYKAAEWSDIVTLMQDYAAKNNISLKDASFYLSHTGHVRDGGLALDYKKISWSFKLDDVRKALGLSAVHDVNDLKAMAYAPLYRNQGLFQMFRDGKGEAGTDNVIIGVGTGLGHAFLSNDKKVRETYGGHFPLTAVTDGQKNIVAALDAKNPIFETVLSGEGLFRLYAAIARVKNVQPKATNVFDMMANAETDALVKEAAVQFSGFLGLYAHILCNAAYAYSGVYLTGGVMNRVINAGLFDPYAFIGQFQQNMVPVVAKSLEATPLYIGTDEYMALYGLNVMTHA